MSNYYIDLNRKRAFRAYQVVNALIQRKDDEDKYTKDMDEENKRKWQEEQAKKLEDRKKEIRTLCRKLPVLIQQNSLLTTLMYLAKEKENGEEESNKKVNTYLWEQILRWLREYMEQDKMSIEQFYEQKICLCDISEYRVLTIEALLFTSWLKKSAEGMLG